MRAGSAKDDFHPAPRFADLAHDGAHPFVGVMGLAGDLLASGQQRLRIAQCHRGRPPLVALHDTGNQLVLQVHVFLVQGIPFRLADLLDHHLLGRLRPDSLGHLFRSQRHPVVSPADHTTLAVDEDFDLLLFAVVLLGGGDQRSFDTLEDDLFVDILVAVDRIHDPQQFAGVHQQPKHWGPECSATPSRPQLSGLCNLVSIPVGTGGVKPAGGCPQRPGTTGAERVNIGGMAAKRSFTPPTEWFWHPWRVNEAGGLDY